MKTWKTLALAGACGLGIAATTQATVIKSYTAKDISGELAPPDYALRLDQFFGGNGQPTFSFQNVKLDINDDKSAHLYGDVKVAEFNGPTGPQNWYLDLNLSPVAKPAGSNQAWDYYTINSDLPLKAQFVNQDNANEFTFLWGQANEQGAVFQVGDGANGKNDHFGAAGWVNYQHIMNGTLISGKGPCGHIYSSDFLMDLTQPVPEPTTLGLLGLGLSAFAFVGYRKRKAA